MAQTGCPHGTGTGGSKYPDLPAEFSREPHVRGVASMARAQNPNSANSQFFIMFAPGEFLDGQYTIVGNVVSGMEVVDAIKRGDGANGEVSGTPDVMSKVTVQP
jgi:cyclophilin family peptidyl-prolyl cis-trans isomerase